MTGAFGGRGFSGFSFRRMIRLEIGTNRDAYLLYAERAQRTDELALGISEACGEGAGRCDQVQRPFGEGSNVNVAGSRLPDDRLYVEEFPGAGIQVGQ